MPKVRIEPDTVAILLTNQCSAECSICCFGCSPENSGVADADMIRNIIVQASRISGIRTVGFSGGEVFLQFNLLAEMIGLASELGLRTTCTTNGFWAATYERAFQRLVILKEKGLNKLGISMDYFHQQFVKIECLKNILLACKKLDIAVDIGSVVTKSTSDLSESLSVLKDCLVNIPHYRAACLPIGKAKDMEPTELYIDDNLLNKQIKCYELTSFSIYLNGDVYPCCSQAGMIEPLKLGNVKRHSMQELLANYRGNMHVRIIKKYGLNWYLDIAKREGHVDILKKEYVNKCELCNCIFHNETFKNTLTKYIEQEKQVIYQKYIDSKKSRIHEIE